jgi:hypothetical protein
MNFHQKKDGSCDLIFSNQEIKILNKYKKLKFTPTTLRHFGNSLVAMVANFQLNFDDKLANTPTYGTEKIEGISPEKNDTDTK